MAGQEESTELWQHPGDLANVQPVLERGIKNNLEFLQVQK